MKILVLGGSRFIGAATVRRLHELGHEVAIFNRGQTPAVPPEKVRRIVGDRNNLTASRHDFESFGPDVVLHNIVATEAHAHEAVQVFRGLGDRLVMVSSCDVYRAYGRLNRTEPGVPDPLPLRETSPLREVPFPYRERFPDPQHPLHNYDKIPAEKIVLSQPDLPGTVLRLPMVLGPNDYQHRLFPYLRPIQDGRPAIVLHEGFANWHSTYGFVEDVAECIALACTRPEAAGRVYNVGDWTPSIRELAGAVKNAMGWSGEIVTIDPDRAPEALRPDIDTAQGLVCTSERIRNELGYRPRFDFETVVEKTLAWEKDNPPEPLPEANYAAEDEALRLLGHASVSRA